jgi:ribosomal protein S18 acetylase RimI-like enzyme
MTTFPGADDGGLFEALRACEQTHPEPSRVDGVPTRHPVLTGSKVEIVPFEPALRAHFYRLNAAWLKRYFVVEPIDERVLRAPEDQVLEQGGAIFFALVGGEVVGTCALLQESTGRFELSKMAVDEAFQGLGIGRRLLDAAIAEFQRREGCTLFLESSSRLATALHMYQRAGFVLQPTVRAGSHYARADVYMVFAPDQASASIAD